VDPLPTHPTRTLAEALASTEFRGLDEATVEHTERAVLDWLGSALAGALEPPARMVHGVARRFGDSSESTMLAGGRASAAAAAFANGVAAHILELDDIHKTSTVHGGAPIVSAALAVAEREHASGEAFLTAVAVGYEAALRIGDAVNPSHYRFWHPTGTVATFGAAAAAGSLLRLSTEEMIDALGSAGTQAAGLWEFNADGTMSKHLHPGKAAMNGVMAADLARAGFTGARRILEGDRGFVRAMSEASDLSRLTAGLPAIRKVQENCYKLHACCGHTHSAIDLAMALRARAGLSADDVVSRVASIDVETYGPGFEIVKESRPRTPYQAKFSMAYCVAVALLEGRAGLDQFAPHRFGRDRLNAVEADLQVGLSSAIAALLERTHVRVADDLSAKYPAAWPARLTITMADGARLCEAADYPRGNPENPIDRRELEDKFTALVSPHIGPDAAARARNAITLLHTADDIAGVLSSVRDDPRRV
jgi:2-methylcitrate dehydratase PrpD